MRKIHLLVLLLFGATLLVACQGKEEKTSARKKLSVVTTLFPLYDFARTIGGDKAEVTLLLPPGVEAHSYEPRPEALVKISKADLFVFTNERMEPWALKILKGVAPESELVVDASKGTKLLKTEGAEGHDSGEKHDGDHGHAGGLDPHIWLDFANAGIMVDNIAAAMAAKDPANKEYYAARATAYKAELQKLDDAFKAGLSNCGKREFLHAGHYAFGYLATRYGLTYRSAQAVNPDAEPSPARLAALVRQMREHGLRYIYSEELLAPRTAEMIAKETGARILKLHGAHNISKEDLEKGATFISLMRRNLENLRIGQECR